MAHPVHGEKAKLCYLDNIYKDIAEDAETRFVTLNYELDRPFPKGKNKKVIGLMEDEVAIKIMTAFVGLRAKTFSHLIDDDEKPKGTQKYDVIKKT